MKMKKVKEAMPITVRWRGIRSDGELARVIVTQGEEEIQLTTAQAKSLVRQIQEKLVEP